MSFFGHNTANTESTVRAEVSSLKLEIRPPRSNYKKTEGLQIGRVSKEER